MTFLTAGLFFLLIGLALLAGRLPPLVAALYPALSLLTFLVYLYDKQAAKSGRRRTRENTLHLLALAGGWPGALIARKLLRHKTKKQPFRTVFWLTVLANATAFAWLLTPQGASAMHAVSAF